MRTEAATGLLVWACIFSSPCGHRGILGGKPPAAWPSACCRRLGSAWRPSLHSLVGRGWRTGGQWWNWCDLLLKTSLCPYRPAWPESNTAAHVSSESTEEERLHWCHGETEDRKWSLIYSTYGEYSVLLQCFPLSIIKTIRYNQCSSFEFAILNTDRKNSCKHFCKYTSEKSPWSEVFRHFAVTHTELTCCPFLLEMILLLSTVFNETNWTCLGKSHTFL